MFVSIVHWLQCGTSACTAVHGWLPSGRFPTDSAELQKITDNTVLQAIEDASKVSGSPGHASAKRMLNREHFRLLYSERLGDWKPEDAELQSNPTREIYEACASKFGKGNVRLVARNPSPSDLNFPVLTADGNVRP